MHYFLDETRHALRVDRDVAARNMVLSQHGPPYRLYFIDFGLSTHFETDSNDHRVTWTGGRISPPEVCPNFGAAEPSILLQGGRLCDDSSLRNDHPSGMSVTPNDVQSHSRRETQLWPYFGDLKRSMRANSPDERPTAVESLRLFEQELKRLPPRLLYRRILPLRIARTAGGWKFLLENLLRTATAACRYAVGRAVKRVTPAPAQT